MADIGNTTIFIGSPDWFIGDPETYPAELAGIDPDVAQYGVSSTARVEGVGHYSPDPLGDPLFYEWEVLKAPAKSVSSLRVDDAHIAKLEIDVVGVYLVKLVVFGANGGASDQHQTLLMGQPASVAYSGGIEYDVSWIWTTLSDFWAEIAKADRVKIEAIWKSLQAIVAADLLDVFNAKDALSATTIQSAIFRKWLRLPLTLDASSSRLLIGPSVDAVDYSSGSAIIKIRSAQQVLEGVLVRDNAVLVLGVVPQPFDVGRPIEVTYAGRVLRNKIIGADVLQGTGAVFIIEPVQVAVTALPMDCSIKIKAPTYQSRMVVSVGGDFRVAEALSLSELDAGPADVGVSVEVPLQVKLVGASEEGVSAGDTLVYRVQDAVSAKSIELHANIAFVDGDLLALSPGYGVEDALGTLFESEKLAEIVADVGSAGWLARHRGAWLTSSDIMQVGVGGMYAANLTLEGVSVYRRSKIKVSDDIKSLFRLTSRTSRVIETADGLITASGSVLDSAPTTELYENLDFYIRRSFDRGYRLSTDALNVFVADGYDFEIADVQVGDGLVVTTGMGVGTYIVSDVGADFVKVTPPARIQFTDAEFYVSSPAAYINFTPDALRDHLLEELWAEYAVFDNSEVIESTFGVPLGLSADFWERLHSANGYRDAVASILKSRVLASTVESIDNIISLSLGIPIAPYRSLIRGIDNEYHLNNLGLPEVAHITLEEIDPNGAPTGRLTTHDIAASNINRLATTSGLATNPATGGKYALGDTIEQYSSIGEGVRIVDLYTTDKTVLLNDVIDRHRFGVIVDVDSTPTLGAGADQLALVYNLVDDTKPAYTTFFIRLLKFLVDYVDIESEIYMRVRTQFYDNPYHHRGPANILDGYIPGAGDRDDATVLPLTTWYPRDGLISHDLAAETGVLVSAMGGFVSPDREDLRFNDLGVYPWVRVGDFIELRGYPRIRIVITEVTSDTELRYETPTSVEMLAVDTSKPQAFFVYRKLRDFVLDQVAMTVDTNELALTILAGASRNIGVGDHITLDLGEGDTTGRLRVMDRHVDNVTDFVTVRTYPHAPLFDGTGTVRIFRELIRDRDIKANAHTVKLTHQSFSLTALELADGIPPTTLGIQVGDLVLGGIEATYVSGMRGDLVFVSPPLAREIPLSEFTFRHGDATPGEDDLDEQELAVGSGVQLVVHGLDCTLKPSGLLIVTDMNWLVPGDLIHIPELELNLGEGRGILRLCSRLSPVGAPTAAYFTNAFGLSGVPQKAHVPCSVIRQDKLHSDYYLAPQDVQNNIYPRGWGTIHWLR